MPEAIASAERGRLSVSRLGDGDRKQSVPAATRSLPARADEVSRRYAMLGQPPARVAFFVCTTPKLRLRKGVSEE